jgi:hypothetical protein
MANTRQVVTGSDSQSRIYAGRSCYQRPLACWTHNPPISGSVDRAGVDDPSAAVTLAGPRCQPYGFGDPGLCRIASLSRSAITSAVPLYASAIPSRRRLCGGANCQWLARLIDQLYGERSAHVGQERRVTLTRPGRSLRGTSGRVGRGSRARERAGRPEQDRQSPHGPHIAYIPPTHALVLLVPERLSVTSSGGGA